MLNRFKNKLIETYHKLMNLPDAPNKIAGGAAVGVAFLFLPIPLIGLPLTYIIASFLGFNGLAAVLTVILFKWAAPFFFAFDVMMGYLLLSGHPVPLHVFTSNLDFTNLNSWIILGKTMGQPILVGAVANSVIMCTLVYFLFRRFLKNYQHRYQQKRIPIPSIETKQTGK